MRRLIFRAFLAACYLFACLSAALGATQTISFPAIGNVTDGVAPFALHATATSGLLVNFRSTTPAVCFVAGDFVTVVNSGTCSITANQPGNSTYGPAPPVAGGFTVRAPLPAGALTPTIVPPMGNRIVSGDLLYPQSFAVADFNGDGIPDIVVLITTQPNQRGGGVAWVLMGTGSGGYANGVPIDQTGGNGEFLAVGDFNGDGAEDVALENANRIYIYSGDGAGHFSPIANFPFAGASAASLVAADFNGDGLCDLAINQSNDTISSKINIFLSNGTGTFAASQFTTVDPTGTLVVGDFNNDGIPDLAKNNYSTTSNNVPVYSVSILLGDGTGNFSQAPGSPLSLTSLPNPVALGDFNGDGFLDVAIPNRFSNTLTVLLGTGSGQFGAPANVTLTVEPDSLATADFNGDGIQDLAVLTAPPASSSPAEVTVLLGNGLGGFAAASGNPLSSAGKTTGSLITGDLNGDGRMDIAMSNSDGYTFTFLTGTPQATTGSSLFSTVPSNVAPNSSIPLTLQVGNQNGFDSPTGTATFYDGTTTLGIASQTTSPFTFTTNAGAGPAAHSYTATYSGDTNNLSTTSQPLVITVGGQTIAFAAIGNQVTTSSPLTLSATASSGLTVTLTSTTTSVCTVAGVTLTLVTAGSCSVTASQPGNPSYLPATPVTQTFTITLAPQTIVFAPLPAQQPGGAPPLILSATASSGLSVTFTSNSIPVCTISGTTLTLVAAGTCSVTASQAGNPTYAAATPITQTFLIVNGQASQTINFGVLDNMIYGSSPFFPVFAKASSGLPVTFQSSAIPVCTVLGNLVTIRSVGTCSITANQTGNASYSAATVTQTFQVKPGAPAVNFSFTPQGPVTSPYSVVVGDFNGDGVPDVAAANQGSNTVTVLLGAGTGFTAAPGGPFVVGSAPNSIAAAEFNGDGIQDLAVTTGNTVAILLGNGSGGFSAAPGSPFATGTTPSSIAIGDFNQDGFADLAIVNSGSNNLTVLLGNGFGGFTPASGSPFTTGEAPSSVTTGDFNGDGIPDLAIANSGNGNISVLLGNGSGGFSAASGSPFGTGILPQTVIVGDFNLDHIADLAVANAGSDNVTVLLGNGSGGFTPASGSPFSAGVTQPFNLVAGTKPYGIATGDFDGDGNPDLAVSTTGDSAVWVLLGDGSGAFQPTVGFIVVNPRSLVTISFPGGSNGLAVGSAANAVSFLKSALVAASATLSSASSSYPSGTPVKLNLSVEALPGPDFRQPSGTATFYDNEIVLGTAPVVSGSATFTANGLPVGNHSLQAVMSGAVLISPQSSNFLAIAITGATPQTITFGPPGNQNFSTSFLNLSATASSGLTVALTSNTTAVCGFSASTLLFVSAGTCSVTASQAGNTTYQPATPVTQTFVISPAPQTITFNAPAAVTLPASAFALTATSTSNLTVAFTSNTTSVCTVSNAAVTPLAGGTCTITATQAGNASYLAATPVMQSFTINPASTGGGGGGGATGGGTPLTIAPSSVTINAATGGSPGTATITLSYQTFTQGAPSFSAAFNLNQGQGWLSVSPSSGTMSLGSTTGLLFTYTATVTITGDPTNLTAGNTYTGTVNVTSAGSIVSLPVTLNVTTQPAKYTVAPQSLSFSYQQGSATQPPTQSLSVFSTPAGGAFTATATSTGNWLSIGTGTATPASLAISVNTTGLQPNTYSGTIAITAGSSVSINVPVTLTITKANPPILAVSPTSQNLSATQGASASTGQITVSNTGGGTLQFTASGDQSWLTTATNGSATPGSPASLAFSADPSNLTPGVYTGHITVSGASASQTATVVLTVTNSAARIQIAQTGISMTAIAGGSAPQPQTVSISNSGNGTLNWSAKISTTSGGNWLAAAQNTGSVTISANTGGLAAGQYYGAINIVSANAANSPQTISVALNVVAATAAPGISISTGGVLFEGNTALTQSINLYNPSSSAITWSASVFGSWLSVSPASGTANPGTSSITISADLTQITGVQQGTVTIAFGDGSSASIQVVALALGGSGHLVASARPMLATSICAGGKASYLIPVFREPSAGSSAQVAAVTTIQLQLVDDCGNNVTAANRGSAQISFSNGDPGITLNDIGSGIWEATWVPQNAAKSVTLQAVATEKGLSIGSSVSPLSSETVTVLAAGANAPPAPTGIANAASAGQATPQVVAPGSYIAIYGTNLAGSDNPNATTLPLPTTLDGTQLFLGGLPMPLLYAGAGQVNALVPEGIAPNATYPLTIVRGTTQSVPVPITVTELQPGAYTVDTSGSGAGIVTNALTGALITQSNPAHAGDFLVIYATGLGQLTGQNGETEPTDGAATPTTTIYHTNATVSVNIGGKTIPASFAGLTPYFAGLYQVNIQVPQGATTGTSVPVQILTTDPATGTTAKGNAVTITIQ